MTDRNVSADSVPRMESRHPTGRMPSSVDGRIAMPAPVREVRDYCESMGEDLDDFESDVGAITSCAMRCRKSIRFPSAK